MSNEGHSYFAARAEEEIAAAQAATTAEAVRAHYHLAGHYLDLVYKTEGAVEAAAA